MTTEVQNRKAGERNVIHAARRGDCVELMLDCGHVVRVGLGVARNGRMPGDWTCPANDQSCNEGDGS